MAKISIKIGNKRGLRIYQGVPKIKKKDVKIEYLACVDAIGGWMGNN